MSVELFTFAERPELVDAAFAIAEPAEPFMLHCDMGYLYYAGLGAAYAEYAMTVVEDDVVVGRAMTIPFAFGNEVRSALPNGGWDVVIRWAAEDQLRGDKPNAVSALEISLDASRRNGGLSRSVLEAVKENCARLGHDVLYCPLRPTEKHRYPTESMADYAQRRRNDGLPQDPWIRVHVRAGAEIVSVADHATTIVGSLDDWREWTDLPFDSDADVIVEGGLVPVVVSQARNVGVYVEPNVWVRHRL
jgi:hypothetical protein